MKRIIFSAAAFILVITFQNCSPQQMETLNYSSLQAPNSPNGMDPSLDDFESVDDTPIVGESDLNQLMNKVEIGTLDRGVRFVEAMAGENRLIVDLDDSRVSIIKGQSQVLKTTCLPQAVRSEIESLLASPKLCKLQKARSDLMCSMVMKKAFAHLIFRDKPNESLPLGQGSDGCGSGAIHFCDGKDQELSSLLKAIERDFDAMCVQ